MTTSEMTDQAIEIAILERLGWVRSLTPFGSAVSEQHDKLAHGEDWLCLTCFDETKFALEDAEARLRANVEMRQEIVWQPAATAYHAEWGHFVWDETGDERFKTYRGFSRLERRARLEAALNTLIAIEPTSITTLASREGA